MIEQEQTSQIIEIFRDLKQRDLPIARRRELLLLVSHLQSLRRQDAHYTAARISTKTGESAPLVNAEHSTSDFIAELKAIAGHSNLLTSQQVIKLSYLFAFGRLPDEAELEIHEKAATESLSLNASSRTAKGLLYDQIFYLLQSEESAIYLAALPRLNQPIHSTYSPLIERLINFIIGTTSFGSRQPAEIPDLWAMLAEFTSKTASLERRRNDDLASEEDTSSRLLGCWGCSTQITLAEWVSRLDNPHGFSTQTRGSTIIESPVQEVSHKYETHRFWTGSVGKTENKVSIICSLYHPEDYMEAFFMDISKQSAQDRCEYVILDIGNITATSNRLKSMAENLPGCIYLRTEERIGIYEAWNTGIKNSNHDLISNWNVDDFRHPNFFAMSLNIFDLNPDIDILYSDCLYAFEPNLDWERASLGAMATRYLNGLPDEFLRFNFFHNGPIWRRSLHDKYGFFNETLKSAGDYEFWLRCLKDQTKIYFIPLPLVGYYENPNGLSTNAENKQSVCREIEYAALSFCCNKILAQTNQRRDCRQSICDEIEKLYCLETGIAPLYPFS